MAYQETTTTGYGTRLKNSFGGIITGFVMFAAATVLLWWNEGRAVKTSKMLEEAQSVCVEMNDVKTVDPQFDGKLVHATGFATTTDTLVDPLLGVKAHALNMKREVEFYQWVEHSKEEKRDKFGGGEETVTTYTYKLQWVRTPTESANFHDPQYRNRNYVLINAEPETVSSDNVTFGAYRLSKSQVGSLPATKKLVPVIPVASVRELDKNVRLVYNQQARLANTNTLGYGRGTAYDQVYDYVEKKVTSDADSVSSVADTEFVHIQGNAVYIGLTPATPSVGDVRITYTVAEPTNVSILARVEGDGFANYTAKNGKSFSSITIGTKTADEMFEGEHASNSMWTWLLRLAGLVLVIGGLRGIFGFLETILKVIPPLAGILGFGVGIICSIVGFVWSLVVIALAWLFYRPLLGIALLLIGALVIFAFSKKGKALIAQHVVRGAQGDDASPTNGEVVAD